MSSILATTERVVHMKGGAGETSYAKNSTVARKVMMKVKTIFEENVKRMMSNKTSERCWKVVDLGCSSGPNTLIFVSNVLNIMGNDGLNLQSVSLQIYLNDLFGNDFNTIFKLFPDFYQGISGGNFATCFIHATPGNFYGRLYPDNYIHVFHSCYALHWLSQVPKGSTNIAEPLNKGNIIMTSASPLSVHETHLKQFEKDFKHFLKSRWEELKSGGIMVLTFIIREKNKKFNTPMEVIGMVLNDMVQEGLVEKKTLDFFDLPIYCPTEEEVKEVIQTEGSFTLETLKTIKIGWDGNPEEDVDDFILDSKIRGELVTKNMRAVFEPILSVEFGEDIMDELFLRFAKLVVYLIDELEILEYTSVVVSMTKDC
ncbi:hypothetical protein Fmac_026519 [Flemingia macrophylla]|uniref:Uncharacterized protein n=1 Tax=Flemingia macrophylla TaxID=520843 RepID=A0ABD1LF39_9FABA